MKFDLFESFIKYYQDYKVFRIFQSIQLLLMDIHDKIDSKYDYEINSKKDMKKLSGLILKNKILNKNL